MTTSSRRPKLEIRIDPPFRAQVERGWLRRASRAALVTAQVEQAVELGLYLTGDEVVQDLNGRFRGKDSTTDVLSFALAKDAKEEFTTPPDGVLHLGEVIISCPQAERQARERGHSLNEELAHLTIHGVLHLLGYDHERSKEEERLMKAREREALRRLEMTQRVARVSAAKVAPA